MTSSVTKLRRYWPIGLILAAALATLGFRHLDAIRTGHISNTELIATAAFVWLTVMLGLAHAHRDITVTPTEAQQAGLDRLRVTIVAPMYNEDPAMFAAMLESVSAQTRMPDRLHIIDDGSATNACRDVFDRWYPTRPEGLDAEFTRQDNAGKREAQAVAFNADPDADIFATVDSDVLLDPQAIEHGIAPFTRRRVQSVAGLLLGLNQRASLLTRLVELGFVSSFLNGRAWYSRVGSVTVNAGGLAFYRAAVIRENLGHYVTQTVLGRKVMSGDDAMLTRYALRAGRTVFQRSSIGYTLHPVTLTHLTRQRVRWWRSFFWGNAWLLMNFPMRRLAWWLVAYDFLAFAWMSFVMPTVLIVGPVRTGRFAWGFFVILAALGYAQSTRFLTVRRPDESWASQFATWLMAPLCSLLHVYLGWMLQYVGLVTFARTGWSTRSAVEVGLGGE
jgi:hyaluronan synthase